MPLLASWENFYVIVGSAAAALTGLMFVVITLIASVPGRGSGEGVATFGTPNVTHFCVALFVAATLAAPWQALIPASLLLGLTGLGGVTYVTIVFRRARRQTVYEPVLEDWLWHIIFPYIAYITLVVGAIILLFDPIPSLFAVGAVTVLLLFVGIHNSWDSVTYFILERMQHKD